MITYVDTSVLLKLIIHEEGSDQAEDLWRAADSVASVGLIVVEARAGLAAAARAGRLTARQHRAAKAELSGLIAALHVVPVTEQLLAQASELAELGGLSGSAAIHLAAALEIEAAVLTSADALLCAAASRRGLHVANPLVS